MRTKLFVTIALVAALAACETDSYEKGQGTYSLLQAEFVEAHSNTSKAIDRVVTDEGVTYTLTSQPTADWIGTADSMYRAVLYYNKVDESSVEPLTIAQVTVLNAFELKKGKKMKTDPVTLESTWVSANGKYLNMGLYLKTGQTESGLALQTVGVVRDSLSANGDSTSTNTAYLTFYHDQGLAPEYYSSKVYLSIPCTSIAADTVCLTVNTYDGNVVRKIALPQ